MADVSVESATEAVGNGCEKAEEVQFVALKPKLVVPSQEAEEALLFYKEAFGAEEVSRVSCPKRKADQELPSLICAEIKIGSASVLVCDRSDDSESLKAVHDGGIFQLETKDVQAAVSKAVKAGAVLEEDSTEGENPGAGTAEKITDPYGYVWIITSPGKTCATGA